MSGIFFYSILIFILLSIFVPSIYNYAYSCFIGRIVLVLLIIYFSKCSILLGLVFVAIIIVTSMPLYEGFISDDILAKNLLVTSNYSIKDKTIKQQVFNYFTKYYCAKDQNGKVITPLAPDASKQKRWNSILTQTKPNADNDSINVATTNLQLQAQICSPNTTQYNSNFSKNSMSGVTTSGSTTGCYETTTDQNNNCGYWASVGECSRNPGYMLYNCIKSCNRINGNTSSRINNIYNMPDCLSETIQTNICSSGSSILPTIVSGKNVSNNSKLDPYLQQDGQWLQNMYSQLCEPSPVI